MRPDELGAALVLALDESLSLKQKQERDARLLGRKIEEAAAQIKSALENFEDARKELDALKAQEPVRVIERETVIERQPTSDGAGVKEFKRDGDELLLSLQDGTRFRVKLPQRIVQRIDQSGGGGSGSSSSSSNSAAAETIDPEVKTADYTMLPADSYVAMNSATAKTITLFAPAAWAKRKRTITNIGAGLLTVTHADGISGDASVTVPQWASVDLIVINGAWVIV